MSETLSGRHVVVTGGTGALGTAVIAALLDHGAVCHVPSGRPEATLTAFAGNTSVLAIGNVDIASSVSVDAFYAGIPDLYASIHCAGAFAMAPIERSQTQLFDDMVNANARSAYLCCRAAIASMTSAGTAGRIVNVSARPGLEPRRGGGMVAYAMSKAAVAALTAALAEETKGRGILVNAVAPATLDTPANRKAMPDADPARWVTPADAAAAIAHLASPANRTVSGSVLEIYGKG
jgi:NAD(P)-dependent dehydrogenase (short-subunit alcohol dehydrogenase family)